MPTYSQSSPYFRTPYNDTKEYLRNFRIRPVPAGSDDVVYQIEPQYHQRPDLFAYDIYGNPNLWWVFCQRNMDTMEDPIYDFKSGSKIYVPKGATLKDILGV